MKKVLACILMLCLILVILTSCIYTENEWFSIEEIEKYFASVWSELEIGEYDRVTEEPYKKDESVTEKFEREFTDEFNCTQPFEWVGSEYGHTMHMLCDCCDAPDVIYPHENLDADLLCDVCGYLMCEPTPTNNFLRNQAGCEWMNEIDAEDIAEIKIIEEAVGVAPGSLKNIYSSTNEATIASMFEKYYWLETIPMASVFAELDGGEAVTVEFTLKNGEVKDLYINNGIYRDTNGICCFLPCPTFSEEMRYRSYFGFITHQETGRVWGDDGFGEPQYICEIPMDEFEFEYDVDIDLGEIEPYDIDVHTEFGVLKFIAPEIFYINGGTCCVLVGKDLDELISEYTEGNYEYSITMNDREWLYEEILPTYKAGDTVSVKITMAYDLGYLFLVNGEEIATCKDIDGLYWEFTFTMPNRDVVIDFKTYDGFLPDFNYAVLIEAYWKKNLNAEYVSIIKYYGEFESGAIAAMIEDGRGYDDALWQEKINDVVIQYYNGNRIVVLYDDEFYTLTEAYNEGYITSEDLSVIAELHNR